MTTCSIDGCGRARKYLATGWCQTHYHRWYRTGTTELTPRDPDRYSWTYHVAHTHIRQEAGRASENLCIGCGAPAKEWAYDGTDPSEKQQMLRVKGSDYPVRYSVWPEFYKPLCYPCHRAEDAGERWQKVKYYRCGHPRVPENMILRRNGRPNGCRTCKLADDRARYQRSREAS